MNNLTAEQRKELLDEIDYNRKNCFLSSKTELLMQIAESAIKSLPILEQQERGEDSDDTFIVMRNPGKVPFIKRPTGDVAEYLVQLYQHNPEAVCDVVTYRFAGVSGQWVQDGRELFAMLEATQPSATPQIDNDGWIEWGGGECPVPPWTQVELRLSNGETNRGRASNFGWANRIDQGFHSIIAYRVIENDGRD